MVKRKLMKCASVLVFITVYQIPAKKCTVNVYVSGESTCLNVAQPLYSVSSFFPISFAFSHLISPHLNLTYSLSVHSLRPIQSKIRKRSWVLHECVERVPENVDAAKELLQYGLKGTDLEALIAIGNREDGGR